MQAVYDNPTMGITLNGYLSKSFLQTEALDSFYISYI